MGAKVPCPYGPSAGDEGLRKNIAFFKNAREQVGPDFPLMLDCYMALTVPYAIKACIFECFWLNLIRVTAGSLTGALQLEVDGGVFATGLFSSSFQLILSIVVLFSIVFIIFPGTFDSPAYFFFSVSKPLRSG